MNTLNLGDLLRRRCETNPALEAIVEPDLERRLTYGDLNAMANRCAHVLSNELGLARGDRVALLLPSGSEFIAMLFGAAKAGAVIVPLNVRLTGSELRFILSDSGAAAIVYHPSLSGLVDSIRAVEEHEIAVAAWVVTGAELTSGYAQALDGLFEKVDDEEPVPAPGGDNDLFIMYTSGTTGQPKGVVQTHQTIMWAGLTWLSVIDLHYEDRWWLPLPLFHVAALIPVVLAVQRGLTLVINAELNPLTAWKTIEQEKVTVGGSVPAILNFLRQAPDFEKANLEHLRCFLTGAAPMPVELIDIYARRGIQIMQGYALTETAGGGCYLSHEFATSKAGSTGKAMLYTDVRVVDDEGNDVAAGVSGEVLFQGPHMMKAYWNNPEATREAFTDDGWLRTGDIAAIDEDGFIFIKDRLKDMIISGGENVYPAEVENTLLGHPGVAEAGVIGQPSEKWGESPFAVVVRADPAITSDDILAHCRDKLSAFKNPKGVAFVDEIPRNPSGKILKRELRVRFPGPAPE
jgi:acyl-CoA synthetase (AMP-forming)/AMP-acid ligase II